MPTRSAPKPGWRIRLFEQKKYGEAETTYQELTKREPDNAVQWAWLGQAQFQQDKWSEAATSFTSATKLNPQSSGAQYWLAQALLKASKNEEADAAFREAGRLRTAEKKAFALATPQTATPAELQLDIPPAPDKNVDFNQAVAERAAQTFNTLGNTLFDLNKFTESAQAFEMASQLAPDNARYFANWAGSLIKAGERNKALEKAKEAVKLGLKDHWALKEFGW